MTIIDGVEKMRRIGELTRLAEEEYVQELRRSNPSITEDEIEVEVQKWYLDCPEYYPEEFFRPVSPERLEAIRSGTQDKDSQEK